jgi:TonB family protein
MPIIVAVSAPAAATAAPVSSSCTEPDSEARIEHLTAPIYTEAMKERHKGGIVDVDVELLPNGTIAKAVVVKSSGDELLDAATYQAAISTTYVPAVHGCTYMAGSYIFRARYRVAPSAPKAPAVPIVAGPPAFAPAPVPSFGPVPYAPGAIEAAATPAPSAPPSPSPSPTHH